MGRGDKGNGGSKWERNAKMTDKMEGKAIEGKGGKDMYTKGI
jgi:hypothetical protein